LARATRDAATNHTTSADFFRMQVKTSTWEGKAGDAAKAAMLSQLTDPFQGGIRSVVVGR
jgi:hypothetical protein